MTPNEELVRFTKEQLIGTVLELEKQVEELTKMVMDYQRGYSNACVMRDHYQNKYESIVKQK